MENKKIEKLRTSYDELAKVEARKYGLTKDLVILSNAHYENNVLKDTNTFTKKIEELKSKDENIKYYTLKRYNLEVPSKLIAQGNAYGNNVEILENLKNSSLELILTKEHEKDPSMNQGIYYNITLKGNIKGENFECTSGRIRGEKYKFIYDILKSHESDNRILHPARINGQIIPRKDAEKIFNIYEYSTLMRNQKLATFSQKLSKKKIEEKKEIIYQKERGKIGHIIDKLLKK